VVEVGKEVDASELRVVHVILLTLRGDDRILQRPVVAQRDRQGNLVDVPAALQSDSCGPLVHDAQKPGRLELILEASRPSHDICIVQVRIAPGGVAAVVAGAGVGNRSIGIHGIFDRSWAVLELEYGLRIARRLEDVEGPRILVEATLARAVHGHYAKRGAEYPLRIEVPGQTEPRLEVV